MHFWDTPCICANDTAVAALRDQAYLVVPQKTFAPFSNSYRHLLPSLPLKISALYRL